MAVNDFAALLLQYAAAAAPPGYQFTMVSHSFILFFSCYNDREATQKIVSSKEQVQCLYTLPVWLPLMYYLHVD